MKFDIIEIHLGMGICTSQIGSCEIAINDAIAIMQRRIQNRDT